MREIIFRGKRTDNGEWVEGIYSPYNWDIDLKREDKPQIIILSEDKAIDGMWCDVIPKTVGQFTGLYDRNGVKIFEGDIITNRYFDNGVVSYYDGAFEVNEDGACATFHANFDGDRCEVIGNIYDNPELLEDGENDA